MRNRIRFASLLGAVALVFTACGGGGGQAPLAADEIPTPVPIVDSDFAFVDEIRGGNAVEEGTEEPEVVEEVEEAGPEAGYETPQHKAMSMVLVPEDLAADFPGLSVDAVLTDEVSNLDDLHELADRSQGSVVATEGRVTGYRSGLVAAGAAGSEEMVTEVHIYADAASASARVDLERSLLDDRVAEGVESVEAVPGLPGEAFVGSFDEDTRSVVWFANGSVVARVEAQGAETAPAAIAAAKELGLRVFRVEQDSVEARDPYPADPAFHLPHRKLDRFAASASYVVSDAAGNRLSWWRASGVYEDHEHFSCRIVEGQPGTEHMVVDLVVNGAVAHLWTEAETATRELPATAPDVVDALERCPTSQAQWESLVLVDLKWAEVARGTTPLGETTSYRTIITAAESGDVEFAGDGPELARSVVYLHDDGWLASVDRQLWTDPATLEFEMDGLAGDEPIFVQFHFDVTDAGSPDLAVEALRAYEGMQALVLGEDG